MRCILFWLLIIFLGASGCASANKSAIPVYVYHQFSPFVIDAQPDLSDAFVQRLNQTTDYQWQLVHVSRAQLNQLRAQGQQGVILWSNPKWFGNTPDLLVSEPILWDADVMVFNIKKPLVGEFPAAIVHKTFCALQGHRYLVLEKYVANGSVRVVERERLEACMELLDAGVVDFMQMEKSNLFTAHTHLIGTKIGFLEPAIDSFPRVALVDKAYQPALAQLNHTIINLRNDTEWKQQLTTLGESRFVDLFDLAIEDLLKMEMP